MAYDLSLETDHDDEYVDKRGQYWATMPYTIWSSSGTFLNCSTDTPSAAMASLATGSFSDESMTGSVSNRSRSSNVSPIGSAWSNNSVTPPVTPQHSRSWYISPPSDTCSRSSSHSYPPTSRRVDHHLVSDESTCMPKSWELPLFSLAFPTTYQEMLVERLDTTDTAGVKQSLQLSSQQGDPALSRQMFAPSTTSPTYCTSEFYSADWLTTPAWQKTRTIAPKATFQPLLSSSPVLKVEDSSPLGRNRFEDSDVGLDSSPLPVSSQFVVPSQGSKETTCGSEQASCVPSQPVLTRRVRERNMHQHRHRKTITSAAAKPRKCTNNNTFDTVIPQNTFACRVSGCTDKSTGRAKRFKRQEHRKRHEMNVHDKVIVGVCWVPNCHKEFTRTDNLKQHVRATHGKNSATQRNRYVATLDRLSEFYDPQWQGGLTEDGYPLTENLEVVRCCVPDCMKVYHSDDKLKAHLLQHHGRNSTSSEFSYIASPDANGNLFDSEWESKTDKED